MAKVHGLGLGELGIDAQNEHDERTKDQVNEYLVIYLLLFLQNSK